MFQNSHKHVFKLAALSFSVVACFIILPHKTGASTITTSGITISPAIISLNLQKNQLSNNFDASLTNNTDQTITLKVSSLDFKSLNDTGGLTFIGNSVAEAARKHALAAWINTPSGPITIAAKHTQKIPIVIDNRSDLSPGGHYAAVLYTIVANDSADSSVKVSVSQVASTLVFVRKIDGEIFGMKLGNFKVRFSWWSLPRSIDLNFLNTGNSQTVPRGLVTISTPLSKEVSRGQINVNSALLLPDTNRIYSTELSRTGSAWMPGVYKVHVTYHSDEISQIKTTEVKFTYVNLPGILELVLVIILVNKFGQKVIHGVVKKARKQLKKVTKKLV